MKKWLVFSISLLLTNNFLGMGPLRSRLGTTNTLLRQLRTVKPKNLNQFAVQARQLHNVRDLAGTYSNLPKNTKNLSPLLGAINADNYYIEKYKNETPNPETTAIKNTLHLLDDTLRPTQAPGNPFYSLDGDLLAQIAMTVADQNFDLELLLNDPLLQLWHQKHFQLTNRYEKFKDFKYQVKKHLKPFEELPPQERADIFATFSFLKHATREEIEPYIQKLGDITFDASQKDFFSDNSREILQKTAEQVNSKNFEQITIDLLNKNPIEHLKVPFESAQYKNQSVPPCTEVALRNVINYILWDPVTKKLNPKLLPPSIQLNPKFKIFITNYSEPQSNNYYTKSKNDWLELVSNIPGINYLQEKTEMAGEKENSLSALNYLFGTQAHTMQEFSQLISTSERPISFTTETDPYGTCMVNTPIGYGSWKFNKGHVSFATPTEDSNKIIKYYSNEISNIGKQFNTNLATLIPNRKEIVHDQLYYKLKNPSAQEIKKLFSQFKIPLNTKFEYNRSLIDYAIENNNTEIAQLLINNGIDINQKDEYGRTSLHNTISNNNIQIAQLLINNGADTNQKDKWGNTPLYKAIENNNIEVAQLLIDNGADVNQKDSHGFNLLTLACIHEKLSPEIISLLTNNGLDVNEKDNHDLTILIYATKSPKTTPAVIKALLDAGADPTAKGKTYGTPLEEAQKNGNSEIIKLLKDAIIQKQNDIIDSEAQVERITSLMQERIEPEILKDLIIKKQNDEIESEAQVDAITNTMQKRIEKEILENLTEQNNPKHRIEKTELTASDKSYLQSAKQWVKSWLF